MTVDVYEGPQLVSGQAQIEPLAVAIICPPTVQITSRYVFKAPLHMSDNIAKLLQIWLTFLGTAVVYRDGGHIGLGRQRSPRRPCPVDASRQVYVDGGWDKTSIYDRACLPGGPYVEGAAIIQRMSSPTILEPGQRLRVDATRTMTIEV